MTNYTCPTCKTALSTQEPAGKSMDCPHCGSKVIVPAQATMSPLTGIVVAVCLLTLVLIVKFGRSHQGANASAKFNLVANSIAAGGATSP